MRTRPSQTTCDRARSLRREITHTERLLWRNLRDRKLISAKFRRQHPLGPYILDFFCAELNLAVEIDGGQHDLPERREHDSRRAAFLSRLGVNVLRFWNSEIRNDIGLVLAKIKRAIEETPSPRPSPRGG